MSMHSTRITIVGTVATDPRLITTQSGVPICSFRVASGERHFDREQQRWVDGETNWYGITAFRGLAEHAHESLRKGERVLVGGRLRVRKWENGDKSGTSVEIEADAMGHDIRWGVSKFEKRVGALAGNVRDGNSQASDPQQVREEPTSEPWESGDAEADSSLDPGAHSSNAHPDGWSSPISGAPDGDGFVPAAA